MRAHSSSVAVAVAAALLMPSVVLADPVPAEVMSSGKAFSAATSFRMSFDQNGMKWTVDMVRPSSMHIVMTGREVIMLGSDMYMKTGDTWQKLPSLPPSMMGRVTGGAGSPPSAPTSDAHFARLPDADDGGGPAHVWKVTYDNATTVQTWYVRVADGKMHRIDSAGPDGPPTTMHVDAYNAIPPIKPPI